MKKRKKRKALFVPLTYDYVFKGVFGDRKDTESLEQLLKAVLDIPAQEYEKISILNPFLKRAFQKDKQGILDIKIETKSGKIIDLEMQVEKLNGFCVRIVYYQSKLITDQIVSGDKYEKINQTISIAICNYVLFPNNTEYLNRFSILNEKTSEPFTEIVKYVTIELPKVPKENDGTALWPLLQCFLCKSEEDFEMLTKEYPQIGKIGVKVRRLSLRQKLRFIALSRQMLRMDIADMKDTALAEGRAEGLEEGRAAGLAEGRAAGIAEGRVEGLAEGEARAKAEADEIIKEQAVALSEKDSRIAELEAQLARNK
ncbi:MAG: Rpn family recombination-promoting nuclease/putative transposase [Termitinemataceae bacterium]|nr:MAG: Rpn family recombination-promoting nuclease/putative transposase [Termitinemataceae bacterium]